MLLLGVAPGLDGVGGAVQAARHLAELLLHLVQLAQRDRQQPIGAERDPLIEFQLLLEALATEPERRLGARREVGLEIPDVRRDGSGRLGGGVGQIAQDVEVVERRKRLGQILLDERENPSPALEPGLDENAGLSLMLSRAACTRRGTCRSLDTTRRARSASGA
jgi:hypothetical protein